MVMGKLIITRKSDPGFRDKEITVFLDGVPLGTVGANETKEFRIPPGDHMVEATMENRCSFRDFFHIYPKEVMAYQVACPGLNLLLPSILIITLLFGLWHSDVFEERSLNLFGMIFPACGMIIYSLYERKKYFLHLQRDFEKISIRADGSQRDPY